MSNIDYSHSPYPVGSNLVEAHQRAWVRLASPGTWWDGATRIAIARETRTALECAYCVTRRDALSPYAVEGEHQVAGDLPDGLVEVIHRVRTDATRLTRKFYQDALAAGLSAGEYVETIGVMATVIGIDGFTKALGLPVHPLPEPVAGEPSRRLPTKTNDALAWVPTVAPEDVTEADEDPYQGLAGVNIHRALSLVPAEVQGLFDLDSVHYLPDHALRDKDTDYFDSRALSHPQIEFLAARVSVINQCVY